MAMRFRVAAFVLALGWFFACCACAEGDVSSEILEYALQARADLSAVGQGLDAGARLVVPWVLSPKGISACFMISLAFSVAWL